MKKEITKTLVYAMAFWKVAYNTNDNRLRNEAMMQAFERMQKALNLLNGKDNWDMILWNLEKAITNSIEEKDLQALIEKIEE